MIIINFKNYKRGKDALELARGIYLYCNQAIIAGGAADIRELSNNTNLNIFAQHVDAQEPGKSTGYIVPESVQENGAKGTLLNHSEHPLSVDVIKKTIKRCNERGLRVVLCVKNLTQAKKYKSLNPYAMAFEDPKLIASGKSITSSEPATISKFVKALEGTEIIPICGAGITGVTDIKKAYELGCKGVLIASAVADVQNPEKILKEISSYAHRS
jgi:triosephosphate isomerase